MIVTTRTLRSGSGYFFVRQGRLKSSELCVKIKSDGEKLRREWATMEKEVRVRLDEDTFVRLFAMARRYGITLEEAARRAIKYVVNEVEWYEADPSNDPAVKRLLSWLLPVVQGGERE